VRRLVPVPAALVAASCLLLAFVAGYPFADTGLAVPFTLYTVASRCERPVTVAVTVYAILATIPLAAFEGDDDSATSTALAISFTIAAAFMGEVVRLRKLHLDAVEERAQLLERERERQAESAVAAERNRIASELHDSIGHAMNVMVMQAGAGRIAAQTDPHKGIDALRAIEEVGRRALDDVDRMLGVLHRSAAGDDPGRAPLAPAHTIDDLGPLVESVCAAGVNAHIDVRGRHDRLPTTLTVAIYRIVQEALTNALKYAGPARVDVRIDIGSDDVNVCVSDDGSGLQTNGHRDGRGLVAMRERVELLGGSLHTGPGPGGGFQVAASLPLRTP
jgi:signal transduction histidine kinase